MKRGKTTLFIFILCAALSVSAAAIQKQQIRLSDKLIRLHVVANSDEAEDQKIKLKVRDAVLAVTEPMLKGTDCPEKQLEENLDTILNAAQECLRSNDVADPVQVTLCKEEFPTRYYETFSLPAGQYKSLRVTIGEGEGQNWWCVVFPSICLRAAGEWEAVAASAGMTEDEIRLITEHNGRYMLKFKFMELLQRVQSHLQTLK